MGCPFTCHPLFNEVANAFNDICRECEDLDCVHNENMALYYEQYPWELEEEEEEYQSYLEDCYISNGALEQKSISENSTKTEKLRGDFT